MKQVWLAFLVLIFTSVTFSEEKSYSDYWKDLGYDYSSAEEDFLNKKACYDNDKNFLACLITFHQIVEIVSDDLRLVSKREASKMVPEPKIIAKFGGVVIIPNVKETLGRAAALRKVRALKASNQVEWNHLYNVRLFQSVDFEDLNQWVRSQPHFSERQYGFFPIALQNNLSIHNDPHTSYKPKAFMDELSKSSNNFVGIGSSLQTDENGNHNIVSPFENSPALKAGLRFKDIIVAVDGASTKGLTLEEVVSKVKGPEKTTVVLTIERKGEKFNVSIVREKVVVSNVTSRLVKTPQNNSLGLITLGTFMSDEACAEVENAIESLIIQGATTLALDLRGNGGGLLPQAVCISNLFLDAGLTVVTQRATDGSGEILETLNTKESPLTKLPLFVLINAGSASASEIVSGALQDHGVAWIVGERSYGKATVQGVRNINADFQFMMTVARFYLPSGRTNQIEGILPDFEFYSVPNPTEDDKAQLREEDEYQALPSVGKSWVQPRPEEVASISQCQKRQGKAASLFEEEGKTGIRPPDYQLLVTADLADCLGTLH